MGIKGFKAKKPSEIFCHYCHRLVPEEFQTIDHKIPTIKGGSNEDSNFVWSCLLCNILKSDMDYREFVLRRKLTAEHLIPLEQEALWKVHTDPALIKFQSRWHKFQNRIFILK